MLLLLHSPLPYATYRVLRCILPQQAWALYSVGLHPDTLNASIHAELSGILVIVSSAGKAKLSSAFGNAKIAHDERTALRNRGYNESESNQSKSVDLRWERLRDRVAQQMFVLRYIRSLITPQPSRLLYQSPPTRPPSP